MIDYWQRKIVDGYAIDKASDQWVYVAGVARKTEPNGGYVNIPAGVKYPEQVVPYMDVHVTDMDKNQRAVGLNDLTITYPTEQVKRVNDKLVCGWRHEGKTYHMTPTANSFRLSDKDTGLMEWLNAPEIEAFDDFNSAFDFNEDRVFGRELYTRTDKYMSRSVMFLDEVILQLNPNEGKVRTYLYPKPESKLAEYMNQSFSLDIEHDYVGPELEAKPKRRDEYHLLGCTIKRVTSMERFRHYALWGSRNDIVYRVRPGDGSMRVYMFGGEYVYRSLEQIHMEEDLLNDAGANACEIMQQIWINEFGDGL